jgi:hypothetical protein
LVCLGSRPAANSVPARRKRYALVIAIVPPLQDVHHQKQTLYPAYLPLGKTICPFVTNFTIKKCKARSGTSGPAENRGRLLELELRPEQQVTEGWFDRILLIQIAIGTYMKQIDIERGNVVVVGKVLRVDAEDEHPSLEVQPC